MNIKYYNINIFVKGALKMKKEYVAPEIDLYEYAVADKIAVDLSDLDKDNDGWIDGWY